MAVSSGRELDSFLAKFKQLLNNGFEANLNISSKAGKASVVLSLVMNSSEYHSKCAYK